jgi:hypothetical protein
MKDELSSSRLLPSEDSSWSETSERQPQPRTPWKWIIAFVSSILVTNVLTSMATIRLASRAHHPVSEPPNGAARFLKSVSKKTSAVLINTTFYDYDDSVYRKHSSKEADEAWHALTQGDNGVFLVPKEDAEQSGIDPKRHAYWDNPEAGLVGYPAGIEALHQVHCLVSYCSSQLDVHVLNSSIRTCCARACTSTSTSHESSAHRLYAVFPKSMRRYTSIIAWIFCVIDLCVRLILALCLWCGWGTMVVRRAIWPACILVAITSLCGGLR